MMQDAPSLLGAILSIHRGSLPDPHDHAVVHAVHRTPTGLIVGAVARRGHPPCAFIKLPLSTSARTALDREGKVLAALRDDACLGRWRELVPRPLAYGTLAGQPYRIDAALPGSPIARSRAGPDVQSRLLGLTLDTIGVLHRVTATPMVAAPDLLAVWVDQYVEELLRHSWPRQALVRRMMRLRSELHDALAGRTFLAARIHGDLWLGNVLFVATKRGPAEIGGIVDWEASAPAELPLHDVLHLLVSIRRLRSRMELGRIVCRVLAGHDFGAHEREILEAHDGSLSRRQALLLYWLRHAAVHARQQSAPVGYRYRLWERRNVLPVLAGL